VSKIECKKWGVSIPITGHLWFEVDAYSKEEAFARAWERYNDGSYGDDDPYWEACERVTEGNVTHAELHEQDAKEL
jgi:hypothetical protein